MFTCQSRAMIFSQVMGLLESHLHQNVAQLLFTLQPWSSDLLEESVVIHSLQEDVDPTNSSITSPRRRLKVSGSSIIRKCPTPDMRATFTP